MRTANRKRIFTAESSHGSIVEFVGASGYSDGQRLNPAAAILAAARCESDLISVGLHLLEATRRAFFLRQSQLVWQLSGILYDLSESFRPAGEYYRLALSPPADLSALRAALAKIADAVAAPMVGRTLLRLADSYRQSGDLETASKLFLEVAALSRSSDLLDYCQAQRYLAMCQSADDDHRGAASRLELVQPIALSLGRRYPIEVFDHLNSLAVEFGYLGRIAEARRVIAPPLRSAIAPQYPHWADTKREIEEAARTGSRALPPLFAIGSVYQRKAAPPPATALPQPIPPRPARLDATPAPINARATAKQLARRRRTVRFYSTLFFGNPGLLRVGRSLASPLPKDQPSFLPISRHIKCRPARPPPRLVSF